MAARLGRAVRQMPVRYVIQRFQHFIHLEAAGGILLLACTVIALVWANSPWAASYSALWQTKLTLSLGGFSLSKALILWINDGLMAIFFFVVGLEIKREVLIGELSSPRQAALPIAAAVGGMLAPALFYAVLNIGGSGSAGWAIPMATDIAFALGVLALLGSRVPLSLKIFLTALAIVDDLGAVIVIALFYTESIAWSSLGLGLIVFAVLMILGTMGTRSPLVYTLLGFVLWVAFLRSGVHATIAGVLLALTIPARARINVNDFVSRSREILAAIDASSNQRASELSNEPQQAAIQELETQANYVQSPLQRMEHALHPFTAFFIMPVFALANAGVAFEGNPIDTLSEPVALGVILGLALGKPIGVTLFSWLAVKLGFAAKPSDVSWLQIHGASWLCGIGFTMALFIASLAFGGSQLLTAAKTGILCASLLAGLVGWALLVRGKAPQREEQSEAVARSAH